MAGEAPNTAGFVMIPCATGDAVYKWFEKGKGPGQSTGPATQAWRDLASGHVDVSALINKAVSDSGASWEGAAGDAARGATSPLATWADVTGESATTAGNNTEAVGEAYVNAKNAMSKPPTVPDKPFLNDLAWWDTDYDEAVEKNQQVNEQNVRAFHQYGSAVQASVNTMPTFISPTATDASLQQEGGGDKNIDRVDRNGTGDPYTPPGTGQPPGTGRPPGSSDDTNLSTWKPPGGDDTTNPSRVDPNDPRNRPGIGDPNDPRNRPGGDPNIPPGGRWDPNNPNDPRNRGRFDPNDPRNRQGLNGPGGRSGGGGGGGAGGGRGGGAGGLGGAAAARGMGGPGGMGSGFGGAAGVGEQGRGGAGGFGPSGAAGAAGRGGAAGMGAGGMGGAGGKGQGDEDKEHKSASYLQETEDIFGDGTMVAPPVIGG